jgi:hypothetical protein
MLAVVRTREDPRHLLSAQDLGQLRGRPGPRHDQLQLRETQGGVVEEAQAVDDQAARVPGELALLGQMHEIRLDLALRKLGG